MSCHLLLLAPATACAVLAVVHRTCVCMCTWLPRGFAIGAECADCLGPLPPSPSRSFFNHGQCCAAGSRTFVHADIYVSSE